MRKQAQAVMERLKISLPLDELVGSLPIATRQLVAICRALSAQARLVVMDEPTASLTHQEVDALLATIHGLKSHGIATVFVSHRLDEVMTIAERVTVLRDGSNVGTYRVRDIDRRRLSELITGQVFESRLKAPFMTDAVPALEVRGLSRQGQYAGVDLVVRPGEILGITGRLRSGRTELALSLFGTNPPDAGEIRVNDKAVQLRNNREAIRHGIAYVSEDRLSLGLVMPQSIGRVLGLFLSLILLQEISTGFNLLGFSPHLTEAIWGATMLFAIFIALVRNQWSLRPWKSKTA